MPSPSQIRGAEQEDLAERILVSRGYEIIERNWWCRGGEVDRIAWIGAILVFIEIRARTHFAVGTPIDSVGLIKRKRLVRAAKTYIQGFEPQSLPMIRFDIVGIIMDPYPAAPRVTIVENAFDELGHAL